MQIIATNLSMTFNDAGKAIELFRNLNFEIPSGSTLAIMGESGVGKTTLLYLLGALEAPTAGDIVIGGTYYGRTRQSSADLADFRGRHLGFVFQFHHLLPEFDAVENVSMPLLIRGTPREEARSRAESLLQRVGLSERFGHRPGMLSGGEQQRVAIARALAGKPGVVLADEPTGNLDQRTGASVRELLLELVAEEKSTLVVVTHSLELAESMDRVMELTPEGMLERK